MAKGVEDTAFYRYVRLLALNEVGGDPGRFGLSVDGVPPRERRSAPARFPRTLLAGTTHDTKRSADVRARIGALAGHGRASGASTSAAGTSSNAPLRDGDAPDWTEELLVYQTLVGAWPIAPGPARAVPREGAARGQAEHELGRRRTSAGRPRSSASRRGSATHEPFLADFEPFAAEVAARGERSSLGQLVLRLTSPGVPDIYQGDELPYLALVDPDNRRPVDWAVAPRRARRRAAPAARETGEAAT